MCKISQIYNENQRRNNLSKLTTFHPIFQLPHSALMVTHRMMGIKKLDNTFTSSVVEAGKFPLQQYCKCDGCCKTDTLEGGDFAVAEEGVLEQ